MIQIIIVDEGTLGTLNTHVITEFSKLNRSKHQKNVHFEIKVSNETNFVEMRKKKLSSNSIYLVCTLSKCNAKLFLIVKPEMCSSITRPKKQNMSCPFSRPAKTSIFMGIVPGWTKYHC